MSIRQGRFTSLIAFVTMFFLVAVSACGSDDTGTADEGSDEMVQDIFEMLPASIQESKVIKAGTSPNSPPLTLTEGGETVGVIPELAEELSGIMGVDIEIVGMDYAGLIPALQSNRIDINWSVISDTEERQKTLDFVDVMRSDLNFLVMKGNPKKITDPDSVCGTVTGAVKGGLATDVLEKLQSDCAEAGLPEMEVILYNGRPDVQTQMLAGKVDALLGLKAPNIYQASEVQNGEALESVPYAFHEGIQGIALLKDNDELRDALQAAMKEAVNNGSYEEILKNHDIEDQALTHDEIMINGVGNGLP